MWSRSAALVTLSASATAMNALMCRKSIAGGFYTNSVYLDIERCIGQLPTHRARVIPVRARDLRPEEGYACVQSSRFWWHLQSWWASHGLPQLKPLSAGSREIH